MEPITLYARIADPAGIAALLRKLSATVVIDGADDCWHRATVSFGDAKLTFTHDPAYYAEPEWSVQMNGMHEYFSRFPETDRKVHALMLTTTFRFALGTLFEPEFAADSDPRLEVLYAVAEHVDGVLFTPSSFRDARGRILYGAGGEVEEDAEAVWPRVAARVSVTEPLGAAMHEASRPMSADAQDPSARPPTAQRVARRSLAVAALTARAILEQEGVTIRPQASRNPLTWFRRLFESQETLHQELLAWVRAIGIEDELEPDEWEVLQRPLRQLDPQQQIDSTWRLEGLVVLAWALGRAKLPPHDQLVEFNGVWANLGLLDVDAAKALLANPTLRPREVIAALRNRLFALHWRLRNYSLDSKVMDFAAFAKTAWFGPLDLTGVRLVDGDLGIQGKRLDGANAEAFCNAQSAAQERHQAANWLWDGPERYSEASVAT